MGQVALPELRAHGYSGRLATGTLAAAGTLGILIPPSVPLVIYAVLTQESIGKLFVAAVIPGLIATMGYMLVIRLFVMINPASGPAGPRVNWPNRLKSVIEVLPVVGVFAVVIVGIYGGWSNPTEAASIGAAACGLRRAGLRSRRHALAGAGPTWAGRAFFFAALPAEGAWAASDLARPSAMTSAAARRAKTRSEAGKDLMKDDGTTARHGACRQSVSLLFGVGMG